MLEVDKILIVKLSAFGDVVMALPTLEVLKKNKEALKVDWLVEDTVANILEEHSKINKLIVFPRKKLKQCFKEKKIVKAIKLLINFFKILRETKYDVVIDLQGLFKSAVWVFFAKAKRKIGFQNSKEYSSWALNEKMPAFDFDEHAAKRYLKAAVYLGAPFNETDFKEYYYVADKYLKEAEKLLNFKNNKKFIVLNHATKWPSKTWPIEKWKELIILLAEDNRYNAVLTGSEEDFKIAEEIKSEVSKIKTDIEVLNICGKTSLKILAAVLKKADKMLTGDTGPMHLAAAVGVSGVALFGPTKHWRTGPFGGNFKIIIDNNLNCLYCLDRICSHYSCLKNLSAKRVYKVLIE